MTALSSLQSCLATSDTGGIGRFSVYLPTSATSPLGSYAYAVQAWGQNLIGTSSSSIVSASTPLGWTDMIDSQADPTDGSTVYRVTYYTGSPADYIRPNFDPGTFSLGLSNVAAPAGNAVLFFNDANNTNPANPSTFPAIVYPGATLASGFDATLGANMVAGPGGAAYLGRGRQRPWSTGPWANGVAPTYTDAQVVAINVSTTAALTVTLDVPAAAGTLLLASGNPGVGYTLTGSNTLTFSNSANNAPATISVSDGAHTIDAPVVLASNLAVTSTTSSPWTLNFDAGSSITDNGSQLSLTLNAGNGTLILSGSDDYSGGTNVAAGTLVVTSVERLAARRQPEHRHRRRIALRQSAAGRLAGRFDGNLPADSGRPAGRSGAEYAGPLVGGRVRPDGGEEGERAKS